MTRTALTSKIEQDSRDNVSAGGNWTDDIMFDAEQFNNDYEFDPAYQESLEEEN